MNIGINWKFYLRFESSKFRNAKKSFFASSLQMLKSMSVSHAINLPSRTAPSKVPPSSQNLTPHASKTSFIILRFFKANSSGILILLNPFGVSLNFVNRSFFKDYKLTVSLIKLCQTNKSLLREQSNNLI